ncbi:GNAT family N-acetyltransferase [Lacticaseibacillus parakribbianus]|uniref:GNAT family N-acetyltransferase n=1 Tax=Lacticaseibacillus parakribbianus TaxID=2970927 RepID=UPI0021CB3AA4|nr:GNAT family N-acetyltransferase [Lacticaseibacillus parakribbianus]
MNAIQRITETDIPTLVTMARTTFADTFGANTAPADMQEFLDTAYAPAQLLAELQTPGTSFWFATVAGVPAGYLKLNVDAAVTADVTAPNALELERIYILPAYKRHGLGSLLYAHALKLAQAQHKPVIALGVWEHNEPAKAFYAKRGFVKVGEHVFQVGDDPQRDWLMEAPVPAATAASGPESRPGESNS